MLYCSVVQASGVDGTFLGHPLTCVRLNRNDIVFLVFKFFCCKDTDNETLSISVCHSHIYIKGFLFP